MQYLLIDLAHIRPEALTIVDRAFALWKSVYQVELESRGLVLNEDHFWNARVLAVIADGSDIIGTHLYNVFHLETEARKTHSYFKDIPEYRIRDFKNQKIQHLMSMEYLLVNPKYRGASSGVRWAEVIIGLGLNLMKHSPWDAIVGVAREDKKVNRMSMKMGVIETDGLVKNQTPCKIMFLPKQALKAHEDPSMQNRIESLWRTKLNHTPWCQESVVEMKKSA